MADINLINGEHGFLNKYPKCHTMKHLMQKYVLIYIPILSWLPKYTLEKLQCDIIAGVTVGLMVVPQALAYASIARLPNQYGLYSSFIGCFVYCMLGTSKDIAIGPTAILSLLVSTYSVQHCGDMAVLLSFCVGIILLFMGMFRLGFLVRFVSIPVISAFTTAAAITIACGQVKDLNGIAHAPRDFIGNLVYLFKRIKTWNFYDFGYGFVCIIILLLMRLLSRIKWERVSLSRRKAILYKVLWFCGIGRNAILVMVSCLIMYILGIYNSSKYLTSVGNITSGLPSLMVPKFTIHWKNTTYRFTDTLDQFGSGLAVIPLIAFLETIAVGKAFARLNNYKIRPSQELIALGIANILGSFVSAYPVTGSFSRTAVNSQSGVKTPLACLFTGTVVILATQFLTSLFHYIPKACLGAIIISAVLPVTDFSLIKTLWKVKKIDLLPYVFTFGGCFYSLEVGLGAGFIISLCIVLYHVSNPRIEISHKNITTIKLRSGLLYPGVEYITTKIEEIIKEEVSPLAVIIDMHGIMYIDFTVILELDGVLKQMRLKLPETEVLLANVNLDIKQVLLKTDLNEFITTQEHIIDRFGGEMSSNARNA